MSNNPSAPARSSRFAGPARLIRDLPIWTKLGLIMIVPTIATIVVGTAGLLDQVEQASAAERARALTVLSGDAGTLVQALQVERHAAVILLASPPDAIESASATYMGSQQASGEAAVRFATTRTTVADLPNSFTSLLDRIDNQLGQLASLRQQVLALNQVSLSVAKDRYEELINDLMQIRVATAQLTDDTSLADRIRAAHAIAERKEFLARAGVIIGEALVDGEYSAADRDAYTLATQNANQADNEFRRVATPQQVDEYERTVTGAVLRVVLNLEGLLDGLRPGQNPATVINPGEWQQATAGRSELLYDVEMALNNDALEAAETVGAAVQRRVLVETGVLLLTLLIGVLFAWLVARSMARSLRDLRQGALAVAQYGLPQAVAKLRDPSISANLSPAGVALQIAEPLPVRSNDEFGQVTEAFNAVHLEAVRTAAEQAALRASVATMFVNLARRSQILVDRLIGHLDRLERGEQDPDRLSELFQLDHLATRMRRNDENLLVLAGADSTRIQREPAALMDVLRAAQSEVEQYTRVEFVSVDQDIEIAAHAVNDLVHLVAELFDNATQFSPPDTTIRVEARRVGERAMLRIEDQGIGMPAEQYLELNERLATPPQVDVAVSRMMGLVVVSRLAARHGVTVELRPAIERGTIAEVTLPSGVLVPRALAGRSQAPSGFPAVRQDGATVGAGARSPFGPPLALESSPGAPAMPGAAPAMPGAAAPPPDSDDTADQDASAPSSPPAPPAGLPTQPSGPPPFGPTAPSGPAAPPSFGPPAPPSEPPAPSEASAPPSFGPPTPPPFGPPTPPPFGPPTPPPYTPPPGAAPVTPPEPTPAPAFGAAGAAAAGAAAGGLGAALTSAGAIPPVGGGNGRGSGRVPAWYDLTGASGPTHGPIATPGGAEPLPQRRPGWGEPPPDSPAAPRSGADGWGEPSSGYGGPGYGGPGYGGLGAPAPSTPPAPPAAARPSTWPPAGTDASLGGPPTSSNDMTVELPIFSELESAWFASGSGREAPRPGAWPPDPSEGSGASPDTPAGSSWPSGEDAGRPSQDVSWRTVADDGWRAAEAAATPADGGLTEQGLPRRIPMAQLVPGGVAASVSSPDRRTPDSVRGLLSAYHRGVQRGREAHGSAAADPYSSGKEQEA